MVWSPSRCHVATTIGKPRLGSPRSVLPSPATRMTFPDPLSWRNLLGKKMSWYRRKNIKKTMGLSNSEKWPIFWDTSKWRSGVGTPGPKFSDSGPIFFLGPGALTSAGLIASAVHSCRFWECRMRRFWHGGIRCKGLCPIRQRNSGAPNPQLWLGAWLPAMQLV